MPTANTVIERFAEAGIVFERAAASPANDTLVSKPVRPVPFKEVR